MLTDPYARIVFLFCLTMLGLLAQPRLLAQEPSPAPTSADAQYDAARAYQRGEIDTALELLSLRPIAEQRAMTVRTTAILESRLAAAISPLVGSHANEPSAAVGTPLDSITIWPYGAPPVLVDGTSPMLLPMEARRTVPAPLRFEWTVAMTRVAASLHMEAALQAFRRNVSSSEENVEAHIQMADLFFDFYERHTKEPPQSPRWRHAIGLAAMAAGRFSSALGILDPACRKLPQDAPLHLACGSAREAIAMLPADLAAMLRSEGTGRPFEDNPLTDADESKDPKSIASLYRAGASRAVALRQAVRDLELALTSDPADAEAALRLAHVRMLQGDDKAAARLLEPLVAQQPRDAPPRIPYLARLYLGAVRARQRQPAVAAALFEEAIALVPSGRSAYLAQASLARSDGDRSRSAALLRRMMDAPAKPDDPWIGYRFGQYWVLDGLIAQLRKEVQRP